MVLLVGGCRSDVDDEAPVPAQSVQEERAEAPPPGCQGCHAVELDANHAFACTRCHGGTDDTADAVIAHQGLDPRPAGPQAMTKNCGPCHDEAATIRHTAHFTLAGEINTVRRAFDLPPVAGIDTLPEPTGDTLADLATDMLRRRCLRCHLWSPGDSYRETRHGTGCAACHLAFGDGGLQSHRFRLPDDRACLHCHYGNFVGADYYGRFERDYNLEYRTPLEPDGYSRRDYGVEYHRLQPDVHWRAGLTCLDCHEGAVLMGRPPTYTLSCRGCHDPAVAPPPAVAAGPTGRVFPLRTGDRLKVPLMTNPAHRQYGDRVDCAVCHAQWSFADQELHLLRLDVLDFEPWSDLAVQGSDVVEYQIDVALYGEADFDQPWMPDGITGADRLGVWLLGYRQRRWEEVPVCRDDAGKLWVCRSLLDIHLSWVDEDGEVRFDSVAAPVAAMRRRPYMPHTIGKAGAFYYLRLKEIP